MRPKTLEDYLVSLHNGQWFGFKNLNGDDANKTYENLVIHDSSKTKPTKKQCTDGLAQLQSDYDDAQTKKQTDKTSAITKLKELGLTDDEIKAIKEVV
tara:strand:- start:44 stop:337 length:294 start_codon:yes stop_codon:yes gene_type:complete